MTPDRIEAAARRLAGVIRRTPLLTSPFLDAVAGRPVFVKAECLQHTGSFKARGAWSAVSALPEDCPGVIAYSSGNHAQGIAFAAARRGLPAVVVMPDDAPALKRANTEALGAEVVPYDRVREDRDAIGRRIAEDRGLTLIRPFDDPEVIAGQSTVGLEIAEQARAAGIAEADLLVCCGGGGLTAGIALACDMRAPGLRVRPVEPDGFDDVRIGLAQGRAVDSPRQTGSICDAIVSRRAGDLTFPIMARLCAPGLAMPDSACLAAMAEAFRRLKLVLEPGGAIALAAALWHPDMRGSTKPAIAVASGGNVDPSMFVRALEAGPPPT